MRVAVVGAGMAGIACAERLAGAAEVVLFDKGRAAGGRMATRRMETAAGTASFDHGAQYFTVRDDGFRARVAAWAVAGLVARWPAAGAEAWVGVPGMRSPLKDAAAGLDVRSGVMVTALEREGAAWRVAGEVFDAVVLAVPAENAGPLLAPFDAEAAALAGATAAAPCWTVMAAFGERLEAGDVLRGAGAVGWAARDSAKPGRSGLEAWVIQAGPEWSRAALERDAAEVVPLLLAAFVAEFGLSLPPVLAASAH